MGDTVSPAYVERHVTLFNDGVRHGDFTRFLSGFAEDAVMRFEGVPAGPFAGLDAITEAYRSAPPDDTMSLVSLRPSGPGVLATFTWDHGGNGFFILETTGGKVTRLDISFRTEAESTWS